MHFSFYEELKFHAQLNGALQKSFITSEPGILGDSNSSFYSNLFDQSVRHKHSAGIGRAQISTSLLE